MGERLSFEMPQARRYDESEGLGIEVSNQLALVAELGSSDSVSVFGLLPRTIAMRPVRTNSAIP